MTIRRCISFFILGICVNFFSLGAPGAEYNSFLYTTEPGDDFAEILRKFVKDDAIIDADTPLVQKIIKNNVTVTNWENLTPGLSIELFLPDNFIDIDKYKDYYEKTKNNFNPKTFEKKEKIVKKDYYLGLKCSFFYMTSKGSFTQNTSNGTNLKFSQNSPVTAGVSLNFFPKNSLFSYSASGYYSYLLPADSNLDSGNFTIPPEYGANFFGEYRFTNYNFTAYAGPEIERFSTFNTEGIINENKIYMDQSKVIYGTLGLQRSISLIGKNIFIKASYSRSLISTFTNDYPNHQLAPSSFSGSKFMFYLNYKFNQKFYFHSLIKYHVMTGPSNLSVFRVGIGFGYILF